jgi:Cu(I)/Ag(I) efflux system membrane fusion protein
MKYFSSIRLLGIALALLLVLAMLSACKQKATAPADPDVYYTCSMDPQVVEYKPGTCPICKMDLTPVRKQKGEKSNEITLSEQQIQLGNITSDTLRSGTIGDQMVLAATLNFDQMKAATVSARVMGRIEKLYVKNTGDYVAKGTPLFDLYSEDLNNAKQEYLLSLQKAKTFRGESMIDLEQLVQSARHKLLLWGMRETDIMQLAKEEKALPVTTFYSPEAGYVTQFWLNEGDYTMEGGSVVTLADLSSLWAEAQVYSSQLADIDPQSLATVVLPDLPGQELKGRIDFVNPEVAPDSRINLLRVSIPNKGNLFKPGMPAYVLLKSPQRKGLTLPIDAVIRDSRGASVWLRTGSNTFKSVMVGTGLESGDRIEITSGLHEHDVVVLSGAYLLHSEYFFKKGTNAMASHNH